MTDTIFDGQKFSKLNNKDREYHNFTLDKDGYVARRTLSKGEFSLSGLSKDLLVTTMLIEDTATPMPNIPLTDRNTLSLINLGENTLYVGNINVTADRSLGTTAGWEVGPNEGINFDIKGEVTLWGICEVGKKTLVKIMEIA